MPWRSEVSLRTAGEFCGSIPVYAPAQSRVPEPGFADARGQFFPFPTHGKNCRNQPRDTGKSCTPSIGSNSKTETTIAAKPCV
jgi:hypothetical protein